jgi:squalene monooxygenase
MQASKQTIPAEGIRSTYDAVVIGAGPAGCGAAACLAARGASVLLIESNPKAAKRFAGELIHPEGVRVLREHGLLDGLTPRIETAGFVVCPNDGLGQIRLDYPDGSKGFACEHETLVTHLRRQTAAKLGVEYVEGARARPAGAHTVKLLNGGHTARRVNADRIVVAAGRSFGGSSSAGAKPDGVVISRMAGLLITGVELPADGFGHVILGGPGPVLAYRIDERRIRLCVDVPHTVHRGSQAADWIWESFADVLPESLRGGVRRELARASLSWAANVFRPRTYRTEMGLALVGDAAGVFHPLTAMGITMSLLDAEALARASCIEDYEEPRSEQTFVPELLSNAIYQAFARDDAGSKAIRESILRSWRASKDQRNRTMRLLGATSTRRADFVDAFARVALRAGATSLLNDRQAFLELRGWLRWPWASLHPRPSEIRNRTLSWAAPGSWSHPTFLRTSTSSKEKRNAI